MEAGGKLGEGQAPFAIAFVGRLHNKILRGQ